VFEIKNSDGDGSFILTRHPDGGLTIQATKQIDRVIVDLNPRTAAAITEWLMTGDVLKSG
jgi:hypothetical protein